MTDSQILDQLCLLLDCGRKDVVARVNRLRTMDSAFLDKPEDRLYHASDRTWWKRVGGNLQRANPPELHFPE